eukprot:4968830-Amphidinium_carterae.2
MGTGRLHNLACPWSSSCHHLCPCQVSGAAQSEENIMVSGRTPQDAFPHHCVVCNLASALHLLSMPKDSVCPLPTQAASTHLLRLVLCLA